MELLFIVYKMLTGVVLWVLLPILLITGNAVVKTLAHKELIAADAEARLRGTLAFDFVPPDYYADYPKPCMGGWAQDAFVIVPDGSVEGTSNPKRRGKK